MDYQKLADALMEGGDARSAVFRQGMIDFLKRRIENLDIASPYREGTVESDAYIAGSNRGMNEWRYALHINCDDHGEVIAYFERLIQEAA